MTDQLLFPVGHYLGPYNSGTGEEPRHRVRVGRTRRSVPSEQALLAWLYGHGVPGRNSPWTRASLVDRARLMLDEDVADEVAALIAAGLMVEVVESRDFAQRYRLRALMMCLGPDPDQAGHFLLGLPGHPAMGVSSSGRDVWLAAQHAPSLWSACQILAENQTPANQQPGPHAGDLFGELIAHLVGWLAAGVGYLDIAEPSHDEPLDD